jgi:hypothetical protein
MNPSTPEIRKPRTDDRPLWDLVFSLMVGPAVLVAHDLKLFTLLAEKPRALSEVCEALNIRTRPAEVLLSVCTAVGLIELADGRYWLTPLAEDYLLESSPTYFGGYLDLKIANQSLYSYETLKEAVLSDSPQIYAGKEIFEAHDEQEPLAARFTRAMHSLSMGPALSWPERIDLSGHRLMIDVGGGSGAHAIGALQRWPDLRAIVFERPNVCSVSSDYISRYGLSDRIQTHCADMWTDPFPAADVHFYSMIYHDWPPEKCRFLTRKSFESLDPGGMILIHEILYNDEKTGPLPAAAFSVNMLLVTTGRQYSGQELLEMLGSAGFTDLDIRPTFGYWSMVTGRKPSLPEKTSKEA